MQNTVTQLVKIPPAFTSRLDSLYVDASEAVKQMLADSSRHSSKDYPSIPCVVAKSLINKYQRNWRCKSVTHLVLPICGDKGRQVKVVPEGFRVPAVFGKAVIPRRVEASYRGAYPTGGVLPQRRRVVRFRLVQYCWSGANPSRRMYWRR